MTASSRSLPHLGVGSVASTLMALGLGQLETLEPPHLAPLIDHTLLRPDADSAAIDRLIAEARTHGFASVCVNPYWVPRVAKGLQGTTVRTCTVVGFPLGANQLEIKRHEAALALEEGAEELDMVINIGALKSGSTSEVAREIRVLADLCQEGTRLLKVIIESGLLSPQEIQLASTLSRDNGAHFVKTSTGFASQGASAEAIRLMRESAGSKLGIKASGGVANYTQALAMLGAGATRIGTSKGVSLIQGQT
jgi:deoxyribose-phosphate aldolase